MKHYVVELSNYIPGILKLTYKLWFFERHREILGRNVESERFVLCRTRKKLMGEKAREAEEEPAPLETSMQIRSDTLFYFKYQTSI
jgi:hypothetical protein